MGKFAADAVAAILSGIGLGLLKNAADDGNKIAQEICEKANIEVEPKENNEDESNKVIGFHCE